MKLLLTLLAIVHFSFDAHAYKLEGYGNFFVDGWKDYCSYKGYFKYEDIIIELDSSCKKNYSIHVTFENGGKYRIPTMNQILENHIARLCDFEKQIIVKYATKEYDGASFVCKK